jgi:hypothetical protein
MPEGKSIKFLPLPCFAMAHLISIVGARSDSAELTPRGFRLEHLVRLCTVDSSRIQAGRRGLTNGFRLGAMEIA